VPLYVSAFVLAIGAAFAVAAVVGYAFERLTAFKMVQGPVPGGLCVLVGRKGKKKEDAHYGETSVITEKKEGTVIWDLDGVIVDSAPFHFKSWKELAEEEGVSFGEDDFKRSFGKRNEEILRDMFGDHISPEETSRLSLRKEEKFRKLIRGQVEALPGALSLIEQLHEAGFKQALASSTPLQNIELILGELAVRSFFRAIVSAEDVEKGKPDPEAFLAASTRIGTPPEQCLVIEDAVAGIRAANAAGTKSVGLTTTHPREALSEGDLVVDSLEELNPERVESLLGLAPRP
jgi:beta-phosphoglucomutase family hydrolase